MRWAQVIDGTVRNRILWDGQGTPPQTGLVPEADADGLPDYVEPVPVVVPESVATHKMLIAMDAAGMLESVQALVNAVGGALKIAFDRAPQIHRASPMVAGMAAQLGLTSEQVDALFIAAAAIEA